MSKNIYISGISDFFTKTIETSFYVRNIAEKQTSESKKRYLEVLLQDSTGTIFGTIWEEYMEAEYESYMGKVVQINGMVIQNQDASYQLIITHMALLDEYLYSDYVNGISEKDTKSYLELLHKYIGAVKSQKYRNLLHHIFTSIPDFETLPATLKGHHNFNGGLLVYSVSVTCLAKYMAYSLEKYNLNPSYSLPYNSDLVIAGGLLHAIGTVNMLKPFPEMKRIPESIPLNLHELTMQYLCRMLSQNDGFSLTEEEESLLMHTIGCVYESTDRKPMIREAIILKNAIQLQGDVSRLEYFLFSNQDKCGSVFDPALNNYIYIQKEHTDNG